MTRLTPNAAAERSGQSRATITRAIAAGELEATKHRNRWSIDLDDLDRRIAEQHAPAADGVTVATLHAAKGLEWDAVFLTGLSEGLMPITFAETSDEIDEERRLLYVGITRAREQLMLSCSASRTPGGRANRRPSRFLKDLLLTR